MARKRAWTVVGEDDDDFALARDRLVRGFRRWLSDEGLEYDAWLVEPLLHYKRDSDGHLCRWSTADVEDALLEWFPRQITLDEEGLGEALSAIGLFFTYLDGIRLLDPKGDDLGELIAEIESCSDGFCDAMTDPSAYGPAKAIVAAMRAEGVDLGDEDAVRTWVRDWKEKSPEDREESLDLDTAIEMPPVVVLAEEELTVMASETQLMARLPALLETPSARGDDDAFLLQLAEASGFLEPLDARLCATERAAWVSTRPLDAWEALMHGLFVVGPLSGEEPAAKDAFWRDHLDGCLVDLLSMVYAAGLCMPVDEFARLAAEEVRRAFELDEGAWRSLAEGDARRIADRLTLVGAATANDGNLALTPLGTWLTNRVLLASGADAPIAGRLARAEAAHLIAECAEMDEDMADAELENWCVLRDPASAAAEIGAVARTTGDPAIRMTAFHALGFAGDAAEPVIRRLADIPSLRPYASVWLVTHGKEEARKLRDADTPALLVETLSVLLNNAGPKALARDLAELGPPEEQAALLGTLWRVDGPFTALVLEAFAEHHPEKTVAKAARKALFKHRSAGTAS